MSHRGWAVAGLILTVTACSSQPGRTVPYTGTPAAQSSGVDSSPTPSFRVAKLGEKGTNTDGNSLQLTHVDYLSCAQINGGSNFTLAQESCSKGEIPGIYVNEWTMTNGTQEPMDAYLSAQYSHNGQGEAIEAAPIIMSSGTKYQSTQGKILPGKSGRVYYVAATGHEPTDVVVSASLASSGAQVLFQGDMKALANR